jgi:hypothetical protein
VWGLRAAGGFADAQLRLIIRALVLAVVAGRRPPAILGGPALDLAGNSLFKWLTASCAPLSHTIRLGLLVLLILAVPYLPPVGV